MRVLVLVISDSSHPVYEHHRRMWRETPKHPEFDVFFIESRPDVDTPHVNGDTFATPGHETFRGIIRKTIDALDYFLEPGHPYDWVVRTNLSSHYHFPGLSSFLSSKTPTQYYGGYAGWYNGIPYISGSGIYMSPDICDILRAHRNKIYSIGIMDDVDIGFFLHSQGIVARGCECRTDFYSVENFHPSKCLGFHYRIKHYQDTHRRIEHEPEIRRRLMEVLANPAPQ